MTVALRPPRHNDGHPSLVTWLLGGLLALVAALTVLAVVPFTLANDALSATKKVELVTSVVPALAFVVVGAVIVSRRPSNVVGWLCCAVGLGQSLATFGGQGATAILATDPDRIPGGLVLSLLGGLAWELSWVSLSLQRPAAVAALAASRLGGHRRGRRIDALGPLPARSGRPWPAGQPAWDRTA